MWDRVLGETTWNCLLVEEKNIHYALRMGQFWVVPLYPLCPKEIAPWALLPLSILTVSLEMQSKQKGWGPKHTLTIVELRQVKLS